MSNDSQKGASRWELLPADPAGQERLCRELEIHPILARLLLNRGISDSSAAYRFLNPSLSDLRPPFGEDSLPDIEKAVERVVRVFTQREKVTIFGDYDADGISATVILYTFLARSGADVTFELPNRLKEGYGLNPDAVRRIAARGSRLIITVDCGTSDFEEITLARDLDIDVVVLDHHQVGERLPPAHSVVNPHRPDSRFPFAGLAGVGVTFYFLVALRQRMRELGMLPPEGHNLREYLDLVALGTIADMVPLREENRIFTTFGLRELSRADRPGIRALREVAGTIGKNEVRVGEVGFYLAPRINAGGRLGDSRIGAELLLAGEMEAARELARTLDSSNRFRQREEEKILREARQRILAQCANTGKNPVSVVLGSEGWHAGVVGIVASKLLDEFYCPVCLISITDGNGRGSGRSIPGISIHRILHDLSDQLITFGGHEMAAGFTIAPAAIPRFSRDFAGEVEKSTKTAPRILEPRVKVDAEVDFIGYMELSGIGIEQLSPHGISNPEPVFLSRGLRVREKRLIRSRHLKMVLDWERDEIQAIGFGMAKRFDVRPGDELDILFQYREEKNRWQGREQLPDLLIRDIKRVAEEV